jgi:site-specific DNA-cytosine methylase
VILWIGTTTQYPKKYLDVIWASPPCTEYSRALTTRERDIEGANEIVEKHN